MKGIFTVVKQHCKKKPRKNSEAPTGFRPMTSVILVYIVLLKIEIVMFWTFALATGHFISHDISAGPSLLHGLRLIIDKVAQANIFTIFFSVFYNGIALIFEVHSCSSSSDSGTSQLYICSYGLQCRKSGYVYVSDSIA